MDRLIELEEGIRTIQLMINQYLPFTPEYEYLRKEVNDEVNKLNLVTYEV